MKRKFKVVHRYDLKTKEEILKRLQSLKTQLKEAKKTAPSFSRDDQALRTYKAILSARIQELSWVLNDTNLFTI